MKRITRHIILVLAGDFLIALFAFGVLYYFGKLPHWYHPLLSAFLWVILGVVSQKLRFGSYKRMLYAWIGIFFQNVFAGFFIFLLYRFGISGYRYHYSIIVVLLIILLLELLFYSLLRRFVYKKIPYFYEEPVLDDVYEKGVYSLQDKKETTLNKDVEKYIDLIHNVPNGSESDIREIGKNKGIFSDSTILLDTYEPEEILRYKEEAPKFIVHLRSLNRIRHINKLFANTNYCLSEEGCIACHCLTSVLHRKKVLRQSPPVINLIVYGLDFFWHRVCAKLALTRPFYFWVTGGKSRVLTRVEVLGRIYRAGFDVIHEEVSNGRFYVVAKKIKEPISDDKPSNGILIRLRRYGKGGKIIGVYKLRTMYSYSEYLQPYVFKQQGLATGGKISDDYRVSPLGHFLRKTWLDELPMLINWLKGDLKIVGVRPLSTHYFNLYDEDLQELRTKTKPGLLPPFYADMPKTMEEIQESERRYLNAYFKNPIRTDWKYFWKILSNIVVKGKRSG